VDVSFKPLTTKQRRDLEGYVAVSGALFRAFLFVAAVGIVVAFCRGLAVSLAMSYPAFDNAAWWAVPSVVFAAGLYRIAGRWTGGRALRARIRADLTRGEAAAKRVVAIEAIAIEEEEDEGPGYFLLTNDGKTMLFAGQYLEPFVRKGFPWTAFDILEAPESQMFFGLAAAGTRLKPSHTRGPLTWEESKAFGILNAKYVTLDRDFEGLTQITP
jgi:hypothetical protein